MRVLFDKLGQPDTYTDAEIAEIQAERRRAHARARECVIRKGVKIDSRCEELNRRLNALARRDDGSLIMTALPFIFIDDSDTTGPHTVTGSDGRVWTFTYSRRFGPLLLRKDGELRKRQPHGDGHPFWPAFEGWEREHG